MIYKEPELNNIGQPLCEFCQVGYDRLLRHVGHRHGLNALDYKKKFGYNPRKGIVSRKTALKAKKNVLKNYDTVIMKNLVIGGLKTRFKKGNRATDKELVGKIAKARMTAYWASKQEMKDELISRLTAILKS